MLGIDKDGMKKVLTITIGENESAKYWMTVLNELKNRGVQDILVLCADGLTGLKDAISAIYPKTEYQRCMVHQIRNSSFKQSVSSWKDVVEAGTDCDVLAIVLPPAILADLTNPRNNSKPVIRAKANRVPTGNTIVNPATGKEETEYRFEHARW